MRRKPSLALLLLIPSVLAVSLVFLDAEARHSFGRPYLCSTDQTLLLPVWFYELSELDDLSPATWAVLGGLQFCYFYVAYF